MVRMQVYKVGVDPHKRIPFVLLADGDIERLLPIFIGPFEANAIASQLQGVDFPRPLTHDLMRAIIEEMGLRLDSVWVTRLEEGTFFALLHLHGPVTALQIDARPSDAIALALRMHAPILVAEEVLEAAQILRSDLQDDSEMLAEMDRFRELMGEFPAEPDLSDTEDVEG
jgi:uncharacterized protein